MFSDSDGIGGAKAAEWETFDIPASNTLEVILPVVAGEYLFLEVRETAGKDNAVGDGEDISSENGEPGADGERDNLNDSAWTSPVWFVLDESSNSFVWSKRSSVYHDPDCFVVGRIGSANRREGPAPEGKEKHDCRPAQAQ